MQLPVLSFSAMIEQMAATLQGTATALIDLTVGSVLRALLEASASVALWLQWLILQVLSMTRAATSAGPDLDTWMADFSLTRLPAVASAGIVTFSRYTPGITATILVGTGVRVTQGTQTFSVVAQASNPDWNGSTGYSLLVGVSSVDVPVAASQPGSAGNVQAGAVGLLSSPIVGVDSVTNANAILGGVDAESDAALRLRFQLYINSRSQATDLAVQSAIANLQQGLRYVVLENQTAAEQPLVGNFCAIVDDGSGNPPQSLLSAAQTAIEAVRPIGSTFSVAGPVITTASVNIVIATSNSLTHASVAAAVLQSVITWIYGLPVGGLLAISKLEAIAHDTDSSVLSVLSAVINNLSEDLQAPSNGVIIASSVTVS
jgi:uncharacterized phage protein gp47/JayE